MIAISTPRALSHDLATRKYVFPFSLVLSCAPVAFYCLFESCFGPLDILYTTSLLVFVKNTTFIFTTIK